MFKGGIQATQDAAAALALMLKPGMVVSLVGDLGAGKTTLVAALAAALQSDHPVSSPTFTVIHEVPTPTLMLCHIDAYRCSARDVLNLGLDDYQQAGFVLLVEWLEMFADAGPIPDITVTLCEDYTDPDVRSITIDENGGQA
ncbi:MAG: tRNA ((37)-N6)-threonylcarbamoyltransferase complex ATPase subunit type 1 TsaE [Armatimonadota bacterium]